MKKIVLMISLLTLSACHDALMGSPQENIDRATIVCRDHVEYLGAKNAYGDSFSAHISPDGRPFTC